MANKNTNDRRSGGDPRDHRRNIQALRSERLEAALARALEGEDVEVFLDQIDRVSGLPGPRPNVDVLLALGGSIAAAGPAGDELCAYLLEDKKVSRYWVGIATLAARATKKNEKRALGELVDRADEVEKEKRDAVVTCLSAVLATRGDEALPLVRQRANGYLHAHVALEAMTSQRALSAMKSGDELIGLLGEAFAMSDESPRAAERSQGLRLLRQELPAQIIRAFVRFADLAAFVEERTAIERPESREIVGLTIAGLRKILGEAEADRLRLALEGTAKAPRDPTRIVQGTRKRSRGR